MLALPPRLRPGLFLFVRKIFFNFFRGNAVSRLQTTFRQVIISVRTLDLLHCAHYNISKMKEREATAMYYETLHEVQDLQKVEELTESMVENGWQGAPLVVWGDGLITGVHRYAAAQEAGIEVPTVNLEDVFGEAGIDFEKAWETEGQPTYGEYGMICLLELLPSEVRDAYGIDVH